jgi:hypothetical protein
MKTDDLVVLLASGDVPVAGAAAQARRRFTVAVGGGFAASVLLMLVVLGLNPRLDAYLLLPMHWVKVAFALLLAAGALLALAHLARPGARPGAAPWLIGAPVLAVAALAIVTVINAAPAERAGLLFGNTWAVCPLSIAMLALPTLVLVAWAMRAMAPTRLRLAGAAAGLLAGASGAVAYTLHCPELAAPFIAVWYVLGALVPSALGAWLGPRVLRW